MKATIKLLTVAGFAGLSLAACGTSKSTEVASAGHSTSAGSTTVSSTTTVPVNAPVGFNLAKTEFVLPHHLGLLPEGELALAKADPAYAAGLANPTDWMDAKLGGPSSSSAQSSAVAGSGWVYVGGPGSATAVGTMALKSNAISFFYPYFQRLFPGSKLMNVAPISVNASSLNTLSNGSSHQYGDTTSSGGDLVYPSILEFRAAPTGTLAVSGANLPAFCTPSAAAYIVNYKPVSVKGMGFVMTAGPSTVFAGKNMFSTSPSTSSTPTMYDKGTASCAAFH